jgi:PII-like signaling protein
MIAVVDSEEKLAHASQAVEEMIEDGLIVFSDVDIVRLVHTHSIADATEARS